MPLSESDFEIAKHFVPSLEAVRQGGVIQAVTANMRGIVGRGSKTEMVYSVRVSLANYPDTAPQCFITAPSDNAIRHMNIFRGNPPRVCVGRFETNWRALPASERSLMSFFIELSQVLLNENPNSVARA